MKKEKEEKLNVSFKTHLSSNGKDACQFTVYNSCNKRGQQKPL
jgi:hypothetical protein